MNYQDKSAREMSFDKSAIYYWPKKYVAMEQQKLKCLKKLEINKLRQMYVHTSRTLCAKRSSVKNAIWPSDKKICPNYLIRNFRTLLFENAKLLVSIDQCGAIHVNEMTAK